MKVTRTPQQTSPRLPLAQDAECDYTNAMTRSQFLMSGAAFAIPAMAAEPAAGEKANLALVTDFCAAFAARDMTKIASYLAPNCSYRITETAMPAVGAAAVERIRSYVERSSKIEFKILDSWTRGPMVINERIDSFVRPDGSPAYHLVGVFLIKDGKIAEWTDYGIRSQVA
jgi:limonene-1,2-epoxide hydrolase